MKKLGKKFWLALVRMDILTPQCGSVVQAASLGVSLVIILDCVMTFFGSTANDAAYNAWLTDVGDESNRGKIEGINAMMPLVSILVVFGGFMGFNLDLAESWIVIYCMIGGIVLVVGILGFFLIEDVPAKNGADQQKTGYLYNLIYSFRPRVIQENKLLYAVIIVFALFGISIQTYMPYLILYFSVQTLPVFIGSLLMMCGYLSGMAVFGAIIREQIPGNMSGRFQGLRIIGQVLIPGVAGPAIVVLITLAGVFGMMKRNKK